MDEYGSDKRTQLTYEVIVAYDVTSLEHEVNIALQAGRTLHGGVSVSVAYDPSGVSVIYAQAMVREE